jgi:rhamnosyltransferase
MKLAGSVILYNPDSSVINNINTYIQMVSVLYVIDNSIQSNENILAEFKKNNKIKLTQNNENLGVATGLNIAGRMAIKDNYDWLLTMDQDSSFSNDNILKFSNFFNQFNADANIGIMCPSTEISGNMPDVIENVHSITSGSIINLNVYNKVGGFDDYLFIDEVDADFSYKIKMNGFKILKFPNIHMNHKLGEQKSLGYFNYFFKKQRTIHNSFRIYFMVRNYFIIRSRYIKTFPELYKWRDQDFKIMIKNNLFFSKNFFTTLTRAAKGYIDYLKKK